MPRIAQRTIEDIKQRVSLLDVVSPYVQLKRSGSAWVGLSPFNQEKTPSFYVHPDRGFFKCFSTGYGGDHFRFIQLVENCDFYESIEYLAQRFSIQVEYEGGEGPGREERSLASEIRDIHQAATDFFRQRFLAKDAAGEAIREYWQQARGFAPETAEHWKIGYAPPDGSLLLERLRRDGFSEKAVRESGLFFEKGFSMARGFGRFRGRLMIPIRDSQGREVAFTARQLDSTPEDDPAREAKYVNSPTTPVFSKGDLLFGLDEARREVGAETPFLMVEGQLDAIRCWEVGLKTAVAPQGTGVTEQQMYLLRRYGAPLEVLLDGDRAGQKAALKILPMALKTGLQARFLCLPEGSDPDDLLRSQGASALDGLRAESGSPMRFAVRALLPDAGRADQPARIRALQQAFEMIAEADSAMVETACLEEAARELRLDVPSARQDYERFKRRRRRPASPRSEAAPSDAAATSAEKNGGKPSPLLTDAETDLLWLVLREPGLGESIAHVVEFEWINRDSVAGGVLARILAALLEGMGPASELLNEVLEKPEEWDLVSDLSLRDMPLELPERKANETLRGLFKRHISQRMRSIDQRLANLASPATESADLIREKIELRKQLQNPPTLHS